MQRTVWAIVFAIAAVAAPIGQPAADGEITGEIAEASGAVLPGVRVVISRGDERREAITGNDGRFVLGTLELGTYRVATELGGFAPTSGTITLSPTTRRAHIAWSIRAGCSDERIRVVVSAREAAPFADTIAHLRVETDDGSVLWSTRPECAGHLVQSYTVQILNAVIRRGEKDAGRTTLEILLSPGDVRLRPGGEYVGLFGPEWCAAATCRRGAEDHLVFPVVSGRISAPSEEVLSGMRLEEALKTLSEWLGERRPSAK